MRMHSRKMKPTLFITGSHGMVGKALVSRLQKQSTYTLLLPSSKELDLRDQKAVEKYFAKHKIDFVIHLAARVGGIAANITSPAEFLYDNLSMGINVIETARKHKVKKLINLGSSCIYPRECPQPMKEEYLMSGPLEPTNEGYAIGKIAALKLCHYSNQQYHTNFINLIPPNLYGPEDSFDLQKSHVISALITKFHNAKTKNEKKVIVWGTGKARREFLYVNDVVDAILYFFEKYDAKDIGEFLNIGSGEDITIKELAALIQQVVGFQGAIEYDTSKPDGMMKKLLDTRKSHALGWKAKTSLKSGLEKTYQWYLSSLSKR